jgi:hypothetical protein
MSASHKAPGPMSRAHSRQGVDEGLVRPDIDIPIAVNLLNSALTSIARWYHPTGSSPTRFTTRS